MTQIDFCIIRSNPLILQHQTTKQQTMNTLKQMGFLLIALLSLGLTSCGSTDYKELAAKAEKEPSSLTQSDYSEMIDFMDKNLDKMMSRIKSGKGYMDRSQAEEEEDQLTYSFMMVCELATEDVGNFPVMNNENKQKFEKVKKKFEEMNENMLGKFDLTDDKDVVADSVVEVEYLEVDSDTLPQYRLN